MKSNLDGALLLLHVRNCTNKSYRTYQPSKNPLSINAPTLSHSWRPWGAADTGWNCDCIREKGIGPEEWSRLSLKAWRCYRKYSKGICSPGSSGSSKFWNIMLLGCYWLDYQGPWDQEKFEHLLTEWIIACNQPFDEVKKEEIIKLMTYACHPAPTVELPSHEGVWYSGSKNCPNVCPLLRDQYGVKCWHKQGPEVIT